MYLTPRVREILIRMRNRTDTEEYEDAELVEFIPGGWWIGDEKVHGRVGWFLLRHCLISSDDFTLSGGYRRACHYHINEEGRKVLEDPNYIPVVDRLEPKEGIP